MFTVVIPILNQFDVTRYYFQSWLNQAKCQFETIFIDNGSDVSFSKSQIFLQWKNEFDVKCIRNENNVGVYPTFQQAITHCSNPFIFYSHNDVEMLEFGWDEKIKNILTRIIRETGKVPGVCGMFGAKGIGTRDIYDAPYDYRQLMRWNCVTVPSMVSAGGNAITKSFERVIVLDGFSLIVSKKMISDALKGEFDYKRYPVHHNYDNDICLDSHFGGFANYVIDVDCKHHGGLTSTKEKWAEKMGTSDLKIHRLAHKVMYEKFRNRLPIWVK